MALDNATNIGFFASPLEKRKETEHSIDLQKICQLEPEIFVAHEIDGYIVLSCTLYPQESGLLFGDLKFKATSITVRDEAGKAYSEDDLKAVSAEYWQAFSERKS